MPAPLSHDEFFTGLASLLDSHHKAGHGSIYLTQKRLSHGTDPTSDQHPLPILVRATDGKSRTPERARNAAKVKLSAVVRPDEAEVFFARYAEMCRAGMGALRKRDRSRRKKGKKGKAGERK